MATTIGFGGKQWVVVGYDGVNNTMPSNTLTLLLKSGQGVQYTEFHGSSNQYGNSTLNGLMGMAYGNLPDKEEGLVIGRELTGGSSNLVDNEGNYDGNYNDDHIAGTGVTDAKFWALSVKEAKDVNTIQQVLQRLCRQDQSHNAH